MQDEHSRSSATVWRRPQKVSIGDLIFSSENVVSFSSRRLLGRRLGRLCPEPIGHQQQSSRLESRPARLRVWQVIDNNKFLLLPDLINIIKFTCQRIGIAERRQRPFGHGRLHGHCLPQRTVQRGAGRVAQGQDSVSDQHPGQHDATAIRPRHSQRFLFNFNFNLIKGDNHLVRQGCLSSESQSTAQSSSRGLLPTGR